jgi:hypothetical protein
MPGHFESITFPPEWGKPPGGRWSEERALWVTMNVARPGRSSRAALLRAQEERMRDVREGIQRLLAKR